jgi:hypothetical protein
VSYNGLIGSPGFLHPPRPIHDTDSEEQDLREKDPSAEGDPLAEGDGAGEDTEPY